MNARLIRFGLIEIEGRSYDYDVVIEKGEVRKRKKKASKPYRFRFGHTPLSVEEKIPWSSKRLVVGTGIYGNLPIMDEVYAEAAKRGIEIVAVPTEEACRLLTEADLEETNFILHVTC